jgi:hypothetical protein
MKSWKKDAIVKEKKCTRGTTESIRKGKRDESKGLKDSFKTSPR